MKTKDNKLITMTTKLKPIDKKERKLKTNQAIAAAKEAIKKIPKAPEPIYKQTFVGVDDNVTVTTQANYDPAKPYVYQIDPYTTTVRLHNTAVGIRTKGLLATLWISYRHPVRNKRAGFCLNFLIQSLSL